MRAPGRHGTCSMLPGPERGRPLSIGPRRCALKHGQLLPRTLQLCLGNAHRHRVLDRTLEQLDACFVKR